VNIKNIRVGRLATAFFFAVAVIATQFSGIQMAHAAGLPIDTWTGTAGDNKFSTAANWSTNAVPVSGDILKFVPTASGTDYQQIYLTNDLTNVSFGGLIANGTAGGLSKMYYINTINFADGASITHTVDAGATHYAYVGYGTSSNRQNGVINGAGSLTADYTTYLSATVHVVGALTTDYLNAATGSTIGSLITGESHLEATMVTGDITLNAGNSGLTIAGPSQTISSNITINDFNHNMVLNQLAFGNCATPPGQGGSTSPAPLVVTCGTYGPATFTLTGTITLNADLIIDVADQSAVKITGNVIANGHAITLAPNGTGTLQVGADVVTVPDKTTSLSDSQPTTNYSVVNKETATLDGTRSYVYVGVGGVLMGNGTADYLTIAGIIAPGHSPGKLTATQYLYITDGATYQAQLQTAKTGEYDQIQVSDATRTTGQDVRIDPTAILETSLYTGYSIKQGDTFMIINNQQPASQLVNGTFAGLAEGAQFTVSGIVFSISYIGGDGNDVVLTALNAGTDPAAPNTGVLQLVKGNPALVAGLGIVTAALLIAMATRRRANR